MTNMIEADRAVALGCHFHVEGGEGGQRLS